jgi:hypothetical protein
MAVVYPALPLLRKSLRRRLPRLLILGEARPNRVDP